MSDISIPDCHYYYCSDCIKDIYPELKRFIHLPDERVIGICCKCQTVCKPIDLDIVMVMLGHETESFKQMSKFSQDCVKACADIFIELQNKLDLLDEVRNK